MFIVLVDHMYSFIYFFMPFLAFINRLAWFTLVVLQILSPKVFITLDDDFDLISISYIVNVMGTEMNSKQVMHDTTLVTTDLLFSIFKFQLLILRSKDSL